MSFVMFQTSERYGDAFVRINQKNESPTEEWDQMLYYVYTLESKLREFLSNQPKLQISVKFA